MSTAVDESGLGGSGESVAKSHNTPGKGMLICIKIRDTRQSKLVKHKRVKNKRVKMQLAAGSN
jgi:hypothetical protein